MQNGAKNICILSDSPNVRILPHLLYHSLPHIKEMYIYIYVFIYKYIHLYVCLLFHSSHLISLKPDVQAGFRNGRGTREQIANICWIIEKEREFQKNIYFCFIDYAKAFDCVDHNKLWKILKEVGIPDHLTCLLRNLYAGQEATVRT